MSKNKTYIPALKYGWLTRIYDPVLQFTMPEKKFKTALINNMDIQPRDRVLDFGCGSLTLSMMAAKNYPLAEFYGVDVDEKILSIAEKKLSITDLPIQTKLYNGETLPYPDNYFHYVMSSLVFHHLTLSQKYAALKEIHRVLTPLGKVYVADFAKPASIFQRAGFYAVQLLDGFETTNDSVKDLLPKVVQETGFQDVEEEAMFKTLVGTVRIISGLKQTLFISK